MNGPNAVPRRFKGRTWMPITPAIAIIGLMVTLGLLLSACSQAGPAEATSGARSAVSSSDATQTSEDGQVTVKVTWQQGAGAGPVFVVVMDTHSVDLDAYDLRQLVVLRNDQGREARPTGWDAPKGDHHRSGTLTFPVATPDGSPLIGPNTRAIDLVFKDVAGVPERTFRWKL